MQTHVAQYALQRPAFEGLSVRAGDGGLPVCTADEAAVRAGCGPAPASTGSNTMRTRACKASATRRKVLRECPS
ncbi:MAG: hypothetical protein AUJ96_26595 [Armatimonadetes bacterium CG2_30_66_41]|nr:hypothetical protein [Armatimonadota bacterium]OIO95473.1 MAG: hypothetical protein AUJ96_26595 [Armatimonadetes bacterium CG2_30_66_41]